jgi:hypothetical protein
MLFATCSKAPNEKKAPIGAFFVAKIYKKKISFKPFDGILHLTYY